ncbi:MAG: hypothetical protein NVV65_10420 [Pseudoxanthomonas sp.]|nr:hypothetical protein [Pseudoxanthomonas sp.]
MALVSLAGCGGGSGGPADSEFVDYDGSTLVVEGTPYPRQASLDPPGQIMRGRIVVLSRGSEVVGSVRDRAQRYGLALEGLSSEGWTLVRVPEGFEEQWAQAFSISSGVDTTTDSAQSPIAVALAAQLDAGDAHPPGTEAAGEPQAEPSDADVRRIVMERYERLEEAGGLPLASGENGQQLVLYGHVFEARKRSCRKLAASSPFDWECTADLMMGICAGDCDPAAEEPASKGERVSIRWDAGQERYVGG